MITESLKSSTKQLHSHTEKSLNAKRIFSPHFRLEEYIEILQILYISHSLIEDELAKVGDSEFQAFQQRHYVHRLPLLQADLKNLGIEVPQVDSGMDFRLENALQAYGALYVLKGSTLGGKFIFKQLEKTTSDWPEVSLLFYGYEVDAVMEHWKTYSDDLNAFKFSNEEEEEVIKGAQKAFNTFISASSIIAR